jgi:hypothetical protein
MEKLSGVMGLLQRRPLCSQIKLAFFAYEAVSNIEVVLFSFTVEDYTNTISTYNLDKYPELQLEKNNLPRSRGMAVVTAALLLQSAHTFKKFGRNTKKAAQISIVATKAS